VDHYKSYLSQISRFFFLCGLALVALADRRANAIEEFHWAPQLDIGVPQLTGVGAEAYCGDADLFFCQGSQLRYFTELGWFQFSVASGTEQLFLGNVELGARYLPFKFPLYFSAAFGYGNISFTTSAAALANYQINGQTVLTSATFSLTALYYTPSVGYNIALSDHLIWGFDVGVRVPLFNWGSVYLVNSTNGTNSNNSSLLQLNTAQAVGRVAGLWLPAVTLFRLTWQLD